MGVSYVRYEKACKCEKAKATTGKMVMDTRSQTGRLVITAKVYPGPVCDKCDEPWVETW